MAKGIDDVLSISAKDMQLLGLQCGTEGDCAVGTVEAAALGEARRGLLERISDPASSNEAIAAACRVLGVLGRRSVLARGIPP